MAEEAGYTIKWNNMSFDGLLPALQMGKIDAVIAGMSPTAERKKAVDFTKSYLNFETGHAVIVRENEENILKNEDLKDKTVGVQLGTKQEELAKGYGASIVRYDSFTGALLALKQNKIEAVVLDEQSAGKYIENLGGVKVADVIHDSDPGEAVAVKKGDTKLVEELNAAFDKVVESGKYNEILEKYFPEKVAK